MGCRVKGPHPHGMSKLENGRQTRRSPEPLGLLVAIWRDLDMSRAAGTRVGRSEPVFGRAPSKRRGSRRLRFSSSGFSPTAAAKRKTAPPHGQTNPCGQAESWSAVGTRSHRRAAPRNKASMQQRAELVACHKDLVRFLAEPLTPGRHSTGNRWHRAQVRWLGRRERPCAPMLVFPRWMRAKRRKGDMHPDIVRCGSELHVAPRSSHRIETNAMTLTPPHHTSRSWGAATGVVCSGLELQIRHAWERCRPELDQPVLGRGAPDLAR